MSELRPENTRAWCACKGAHEPGCDRHPNPPGADQLRYRVGTHGSFYASMLANLPLQDVDLPEGGGKGRPLAELTTRAEGDPTLALCDAWASVLDVLTFYQERIANEGFLGTSTERRSVLELARQIGYELAPGVAAGTHLAFEIDDTEGAAGKARVPLGTKVSSIPGQDETSQTYETTAEITEARAEWNTLPVRTTQQQPLGSGTKEILLLGTDSNLEPGMALLIIDAAAPAAGKRAWTWSRVHSLAADHERDRTLIRLEGALGDHAVRPSLAQDLFGPAAEPKLFAMRRRASFFGHNAQDWSALSLGLKKEYLGIAPNDLLLPEEQLEWRDFEIFARTGEPVPAPPRSMVFEPTVESVAHAAVASGRKSAENLRSSAMSSAQSAVQSAMSATLGAVHTVGGVFQEAATAFMGGFPDPIQATEGMAGDFGAFITDSQDLVRDSLKSFLELIRGLFPGLPSLTLPDSEAADDDDAWNDNLLVKFGELIAGVTRIRDHLASQPLDLADPNQTLTDTVPLLGEGLKNLLVVLEKAIFSNPLLAPLKAFGEIDIGQLGLILLQAKEDVKTAIFTAQQAAHTGVAAVAATGMGETLKAVVDRSRAVLENPIAEEMYDIFVSADADQHVLDPERMGFIARVTVKSASLAAVLNPGAFLSGTVGQKIVEIFTEMDEQVSDFLADSSFVGTEFEANDLLETLGFELADIDFLADEVLLPDGSVDLEAVLGFCLLVAGTIGVAAVGVSFLAPPVAFVPIVFGWASAGIGAVVVATALPLLGMAAAGSLVTGDAIFHGIRSVKNEVVDAVYLALHPAPTPLSDARAGTAVSLGEVDLDAIYDRVTPGGWALVTAPTPGDAAHPLAAAFELTARTEVSRSDYNLTAKVSRVALRGTNLGAFRKRVRDASVFIESHELQLAEIPSPSPVATDTIGWAHALGPIPAGRQLLVVGPQHGAKGELAGEVVTVRASTNSTVLLTKALAHTYVRDSVTVYGNVAPATHGETREEVLGSGDASSGHQSFQLKQMPMTYVSSDDPSGRATTLEIRVGDIRWQEREDLLQTQPPDRTYQVRHADDGEVSIQFGDGVRGARLPSGPENVTCSYRVGIGREGLVQAEQLRVLRTRPLGVRGVTNPLASIGAEDPEALAAARTNAPTKVLTLDRIVSLRDYENFARTYAGVAKARSTFVPLQGRTLVHVTLAGIDGAPFEPDSVPGQNLRKAMNEFRDPSLELRLSSYTPLPFEIDAGLAIAPDHRPEVVLTEAEGVLSAAYGFAAREFTTPVSRAEVMTLLSRVPGVVYVDLDDLRFAPGVDGETIETGALGARPARQDPIHPGTILPAEMLVLSKATLTELAQ